MSKMNEHIKYAYKDVEESLDDNEDALHLFRHYVLVDFLCCVLFSCGQQTATEKRQYNDCCKEKKLLLNELIPLLSADQRLHLVYYIQWSELHAIQVKREGEREHGELSFL